MSGLIAGLRELARCLGCREDQAQDVVRDEPSARASMSRRGFFMATGAVAAGVALVKFELPKPVWEVTAGDFLAEVTVGEGSIIVARGRPPIVTFASMLKQRYANAVPSPLKVTPFMEMLARGAS